VYVIAWYIIIPIMFHGCNIARNFNDETDGRRYVEWIANDVFLMRKNCTSTYQELGAIKSWRNKIA
jgi:hypothetical protein